MMIHDNIAIADASSIGEARRAVLRFCEVTGLSISEASRASIVVTELATNLVHHAKLGSGAIAIAANTTSPEIEIMSLDGGPGLRDAAKCFQDGFSTGGTPGNGLGAVKRLADEMDFISTSSGTIIWTRIASKTDSKITSKASLSFSGFSLPAPHETACGDAWRAARSKNNAEISLMIADGLGHGPLASDAAVEACTSFEANPFERPSAIIEAMHVKISATRGAAVAVAQVNPDSQKVLYAGVGNIAGTILSLDGSTRGLFTHNGIVGHNLRKNRDFEYKWQTGDLLILHSDGLHTKWTFDNYPGLGRRHPGVISGVLIRDFRRGRDDATVVVVGSLR
jgi:anti-sigma regulatory factor (Ser/Thr protein kinase)